MRTSLEQARYIMETEGFPLVACRGEAVFRSSTRGLRPLLELLDQGADLHNYAVSEREIGKHNALALCRLGVKEVYASVISRPAVALLLRNGIAVLYGKLLDRCLNSAGDGLCPLEDAVLQMDDPEMGLPVLRKILAEK